MKYIKDRIGEYDANLFVNELVYASKLLGLLEAKISSYQFNSIIDYSSVHIDTDKLAAFIASAQ